MKILKPLGYLTLSLAATSASASTNLIRFNGRIYGAAVMGRVVQVAPGGVSARLSAVGPDLSGPSNPANPGCDAIYAELQRREYLFKDCAGDASRPVCKLLVSGLRMLAEGRPDTDTPIDPSVVKTWQIGAPAMAETDLAGLRATVASQLKVKPESVEVVITGTQPRFPATLSIAMDEGSATEKVSHLVPFAPNDLVQLQGDRLVTRNNIFACDLANGQARISPDVRSTIRSVDHVPDAVVDLAWDAHRALEQASDEIAAEKSPLVQAAVIGFHLGAVAGGRNLDDPLATPAALFQRLYDLSGGRPALKPAESREALRATVYPDVPYEETITQIWSLQ